MITFTWCSFGFRCFVYLQTMVVGLLLLVFRDSTHASNLPQNTWNFHNNSTLLDQWWTREFHLILLHAQPNSTSILITKDALWYSNYPYHALTIINRRENKTKNLLEASGSRTYQRNNSFCRWENSSQFIEFGWVIFIL